MKNILVTGGAGFIGSNFIRYMLDRFDVKIVNLDALTYAGNLANLADTENNQNYRFVKGSVCDRTLVSSIFDEYDIDTVVNFAAESHVDRSIEEPEIFITTNIIGTQTLLDVAKHHWKLKPDDKYSGEYRENMLFVQVSTDEVYGELGTTGRFCETDALLPSSPYSASKASADMFALAYYRTFGLPVIITRSSNNYGPYQFPEKLIPLMINNCMNDKPLPVYGNGMQIRDWINVKDHCSAIAAVLCKGKKGEIYNIGGNNEKTNLEIVKLILTEMNKNDDLIAYVKDRPGHDRRYAVDNTKIIEQLGWKPSHEFDEGIRETIAWYRSHREWMDKVVSGDYMNYYDKMYNKNV